MSIQTSEFRPLFTTGMTDGAGFRVHPALAPEELSLREEEESPVTLGIWSLTASLDSTLFDRKTLPKSMLRLGPFSLSCCCWCCCCSCCCCRRLWWRSRLLSSTMESSIALTAARDFLRNYANVKKRKFDAVDFVKRYVGDKKINYDGKLSLTNASFYFVRGYVTHKSLRRTLTGWSRFKRFMNNRFEDGLKQIPFSITRFVIENKFL